MSQVHQRPIVTIFIAKFLTLFVSFQLYYQPTGDSTTATAKNRPQYLQAEAQPLYELVNDLIAQLEEAYLQAERAEGALLELCALKGLPTTYRKESGTVRVGDSVSVADTDRGAGTKACVFAPPDCLDTEQLLVVIRNSRGQLWAARAELISAL